MRIFDFNQAVLQGSMLPVVAAMEKGLLEPHTYIVDENT
jgi:hypothetical protein